MLVLSPRIKEKPPSRVVWTRMTLERMCGLLLRIFYKYSRNGAGVGCRDEVDKAVWHYTF